MKGIEYEVNGAKLIFGADGTVGKVVNGEATAAGSWRSQSAERDNQIRYEIQGQAQPAIPCRYRFNSNNQLAAALRKADGAFTAEFAFPGFIEVDDGADIVYKLIADDGSAAARNVTVYGALHVDSNNFLTIDLTGGGTARVAGDGGAEAIKALANLTDPQPQAADLLRFSASTVNLLSTGKKKTIPANIQLKGSWDIQDKSLVFLAKRDAGETKVGFAGKFKGVAGGFAYSTDAAGAKIGFVVSGRHVWNSGNAAWDVVVGHSQKGFVGHVKGAVAQQLPNGSIAMSGTLDIADKAVSFGLHLEVRHSWNAANQLVFQAAAGTGPGGQLLYDLRLEGTFRFNGVDLLFEAKLSNTGASLSVKLETSANQEALRLQLALTLDIQPHQVNLAFTFTVRMHWQNGKLVKDAAQPAIA